MRRVLGRGAIVAITWLSALDSRLSAQLPAPVAPTADVRDDGSGLTISVLTFGQGDAVWEKFGHNALRIRDARTGSDIAYNWGTFDFEQPHFLRRFLVGNTLYWLATDPAPLMIEHYQRNLNRSGVEQVLALTPEQKVQLRDFVLWNERPENRNYQYDYFVDNCSTRLRDAIDRVLGGQLRRALAAKPSAHTFRSESLRLMSSLPWLQSGMQIALGQPADRPLTAWEESFIPMRLRDRLREVRVVDGGTARPLVAEERVLHEAAREPEATGAPSLVMRFLIAGLLLAALLAVLGVRAAAGGRGARSGFAVVGAFWGLLAGTMGLLLAIAWTATRHIFWYRNENLFQLSPLSLLLVALVPLAVYRPRWRRAAFVVAACGAALSVLGIVLKALPAFDQRNLAVVLLALPVHAALVWALRPSRSP